MIRLAGCLVLPFTLLRTPATTVYVNGGFEHDEGVNEAFLDAASKAGVTLSERLPQIWQVNTGAMQATGNRHVIRLVDDAAKAHGGGKALELRPGQVFLPSLPVGPFASITVRFRATGRTTVMFSPRPPGASPNLYPPVKTHSTEPGPHGYRAYSQTCAMPDGARTCSFTLSSGGALVDDVEIDIEGISLSAPALDEAAVREEDTLLLATGDLPLIEGAVFTGSSIDGRIGKAFAMGSEELLQVPGAFRPLLSSGTIELWCRPHWPGRDDKHHPLVSLSKDGFGFDLWRSRQNHIAFSGSDGWTKRTGEVQSQHWQVANRWAAADWHHIAVSWTPDWYTLFIDGFPVDTALAGTPSKPNTSWASGKLPTKISSLAALGSPGLDLDEVRVSATAHYWIRAGAAPLPMRTANVAAPLPPAPKPQQPTRTPTGGPTPPPRDNAPRPRPEPRELFVAANAANASDDNPGSATAPFSTIGRGVRDLRPGDTLTIREGVYREAVELELEGSPDHPITIRAAENETVVVKGSEILRDWTHDGNVWRRGGWTDAYVKKHCAKGTRLVSPNVMEVFQRDGVHGEAVLLLRVRQPEELREGKCYWDEQTGTITVWPVRPGPDFDPNDSGLEVPVRGRGMAVGKRFVRVQGLQFRQFGMAAVTNWSSVTVNGSDCVLEDCVVTWADFVGIGVSGFRQTVRGCEASYCGNSGMGAGVGEGILIENCLVTHNDFWRYSPGWHGGGAKLIPWFNKSIVRNSEFAYNYGPGLWLDGSCNDSVIEGCHSHDNEGPGIMVEICRGCVVRNNICINNRNPLPGIDLSPIPKQGYSPVSCQARRVEGSTGGNGIFISSSPHTKVYNNLCYRNEHMGIFAEWGLRTSEDIADYTTKERIRVPMSTHHVDIRNNILVNNQAAQLSLRRNGVDEDTHDNQSDSNLLYSSAGKPLVFWGFGGAKFARLETWRAASGFGASSVVGAPIFEFSPGHDFRLQPDSPGVDQGQLLKDVPLDARGTQRPQGSAPDIGPFEVAGSGRRLERPEIPANLTYSPVDLAGVVNRTFADDKADDGQGGWSDQGPTTDLRTFPTGRQTFGGVPFTILAPKGCVVLKSGMRPQSKTLPESAEVPVGRHADVLFFLHSGAWLGGGRHHWSYVVHRGDGTQEAIKVIGGENIRDWASPDAALPFDREHPTTTRVAWTGSNQTFDSVSVYMMAWLNTHTWCDVTKIEMVSPEGHGVPILIAITAGTKK